MLKKTNRLLCYGQWDWGKITCTTGLTTTALNTIENKNLILQSYFSYITSVIYLKKSNYDVKMSDIEAKYFITSDYKKFTGQKLDKKIKEKGSVDKPSISGFTDNSDLDKHYITFR